MKTKRLLLAFSVLVVGFISLTAMSNTKNKRMYPTSKQVVSRSFNFRADKCGDGKCGDAKSSTQKAKKNDTLNKCGGSKCGDGKQKKDKTKSGDTKWGNGKCGKS